MHGCGAIHWGISNLPVAKPPKKLDSVFPSTFNYQQLLNEERGHRRPCAICAEMLTVLILDSSSAGDYSRCELLSETTMPCPDDSISQCPSPFLRLILFSDSFSVVFLEPVGVGMGNDREVPFRAAHLKMTYSHAFGNHKSLC